MSTITPEVYNEVIKDLRPLHVTLTDCAFSGSGPCSGLHSVEAFAALAELAPDDREAPRETFVIAQHITFRVLNSSGGKIAEGHCKFKVHLHVGGSPPEEFWPVFLKRNVPLYVNPAVRDIIAALCMRANIPAESLSSVAVTPLLQPSPEPLAEPTPAAM